MKKKNLSDSRSLNQPVSNINSSNNRYYFNWNEDDVNLYIWYIYDIWYDRRIGVAIQATEN